MNASRYILQSLVHYRFAYLGVLAGAVLGATVLLGALFAGDSVKTSLRVIGEKRIGRATHVITAGDRFFREALAQDLEQSAGVRAAPLIYARGTVSQSTTQLVSNQVQLIGVTDAFWQLAPTPTTIELDAKSSGIAVNDTLARRLNVSVGDTLIVRLHKPGVLAGNAPVAGADSKLQTMRCTVAVIVDDASFGRFSLEATQVPQPSVFLPIKLLQRNLEYPDGANLLLINATASADDLAQSLARNVQLGDYGLSLQWIEAAAAYEVASSRIFIDPELADAIAGAVPEAQPVVSYLVNEFRIGERATPYSIATATSRTAAPFLPEQLGPREIVINDWLAKDLQAAVGDEVRLTYFQVGGDGALVERQSTFRVRAITPLEGLAADDSWMPDYPGMSDAPTPGEWDPGLPLDLDLIREQDERYWDDYRGAPKAFLSPAAARDIWSTRWGSYTALRIPFEKAREAELTDRLLGALQPQMNQLIVRDFRTSAQSSAQSAVDFGGLFLGMSFFLIVAALGLVAMLFQFVLLQRNREDALLSAVGLRTRTLLSWRLGEGLVLLVIAIGLALPLAALYTRAILRFLETIWAGQSGASTFVFEATPASIVAGSLIFLIISIIGIWLAIRRQTRRTLSIRLAAQVEEVAPTPKIHRRSLIIVGVAVLTGVVAISFSGHGLPAQAGFYLAGFAILTAGIALCRAWLTRSSVEHRDSPLDAVYVGRLNLRARRSRSLTVVGAIATAVFMVLSVASFRKHIGSDWLQPTSGTGGFAFWMETTAPLNTSRDGRTVGFEVFEGLGAELGAIVPLRKGVGDNINCFNLNTSSQPQLLAVDAAKMAERGAFYLKLGAEHTEATGWNVLRSPNPGGAVPALIDETTLMWALKRKVGDVLSYTDENGGTFDVRIVGTIPDSLFQGYLLIDEQRFLDKFPSNPGYSAFLIEVAPSTDFPALRSRLETAVRDEGGQVTLTREVLAAFHQIENTYIAIFNVLGSLGVILGSLGLAIVVARNLRERRGEFAVMTAIGIPRDVLARMVFSEFGRLVAWGISIGAIASVVAVWPNVSSLPATPTLILVGGLLIGIVALNFASGWAIFRWSTRDLRGNVAQAAV